MTEFKGIIYKARNIVNGKIYIGYTTQKLEERRNEHIKDSDKEKRSYIFHKALKKYTYHNFHWEIIDDTAKNLDELGEQEVKYIALFGSYYLEGKGYNMTRGSKGPVQKGDNKFNNPSLAKTAAKLTGRTSETHPYLAENGRKSAEKQRGRNKHTHPSVAMSAEKQRGRTKETHPGLAAQSEKKKGRTKETHSGYAKISEFRKGKNKGNSLFVLKQIETYKKTLKDPDKNSKILLSYQKMGDTNRGKNKANNPGKASQAKKMMGQNNPNSHTNREKRRLAKLALENTLFNSPQ